MPRQHECDAFVILPEAHLDHAQIVQCDQGIAMCRAKPFGHYIECTSSRLFGFLISARLQQDLGQGSLRETVERVLLREQLVRHRDPLPRETQGIDLATGIDVDIRSGGERHEERGVGHPATNQPLDGGIDIFRGVTKAVRFIQRGRVIQIAQPECLGVGRGNPFGVLAIQAGPYLQRPLLQWDVLLRLPYPCVEGRDVGQCPRHGFTIGRPGGDQSLFRFERGCERAGNVLLVVAAVADAV